MKCYPALTEKSIAPEPLATISAELSVEVNDNVPPRAVLLLLEPAPSPLVVNAEFANLALVTLPLRILSVTTASLSIVAVNATAPVPSNETAEAVISPEIEKFCADANEPAVPLALPVTLPVKLPLKAVEVTDVNPANVVDEAPKSISVVPTVTLSFANLALVTAPLSIVADNATAPVPSNETAEAVMSPEIEKFCADANDVAVSALP